MVKITSAQLKSTFEALKAEGKTSVHMKSGRYLSRPCIDDELILTIVSGQLETLHVGSPGNLVLQNIMIGSSAERYIIDAKTFGERYEKTGETFNMDGHEWSQLPLG